METNFLGSLTGAGIGGVVIAVVFLIYKCFSGRKCHSKSGCLEMDIQNDIPPRQAIVITQTPQSGTPVMTSMQGARTPVPSLELNSLSPKIQKE
jgi:hypothetical protein